MTHMKRKLIKQKKIGRSSSKIWFFAEKLIYLYMMKADNKMPLVMHDIYHVLTNHENPWPTASFSHEKKLDLLDNIIEYWEVKEDYEKCSKLKTIRNRIENEL